MRNNLFHIPHFQNNNDHNNGFVVFKNICYMPDTTVWFLHIVSVNFTLNSIFKEGNNDCGNKNAALILKPVFPPLC